VPVGEGQLPSGSLAAGRHLGVPGELVDKTITKAVGEELRRVREARGWSRAEFVKVLPSGVGERTLLAYEHGLRQLTLLRLIELSWALEVDALTVLARGLQRARVLVENLTLEVDLHALVRSTNGTFRPMVQWARNTLNEHPDGVVEVEPAVVRNLALFIGHPQRDLANYLARFTPEDSNTDEQEKSTTP
jgi:transcriptional regulator with XRE-family HTH domain